jgi:hypothetical protein
MIDIKGVISMIDNTEVIKGIEEGLRLRKKDRRKEEVCKCKHCSCGTGLFGIVGEPLPVPARSMVTDE